MLSDANYLRERAAQFRRVAATCDALAAAKMLELAMELESRADGLDSDRRDHHPA